MPRKSTADRRRWPRSNALRRCRRRRSGGAVLCHFPRASAARTRPRSRRWRPRGSARVPWRCGTRPHTIRAPREEARLRARCSRAPGSRGTRTARQASARRPSCGDDAAGSHAARERGALLHAQGLGCERKHHRRLVLHVAAIQRCEAHHLIRIHHAAAPLCQRVDPLAQAPPLPIHARMLTLELVHDRGDVRAVALRRERAQQRKDVLVLVAVVLPSLAIEIPDHRARLCSQRRHAPAKLLERGELRFNALVTAGQDGEAISHSLKHALASAARLDQDQSCLRTPPIKSPAIAGLFGLPEVEPQDAGLTFTPFSTRWTPSTLRATSSARLILSCESTKPLNCTTPRYVLTLIALALPRPASFAMAVFTFAFSAASELNSPVERFDGSSLLAHADSPSDTATITAAKSLRKVMPFSFAS